LWKGCDGATAPPAAKLLSPWPAEAHSPDTRLTRQQPRGSLMKVAIMHNFLANNRNELIARCKAKVAQRPRRAATEEQLKNGIPLFLEQLRRTLVAEDGGEAGESLKISGGSGGKAQSLSEMGVTAAAHGKQLLELGFSVTRLFTTMGTFAKLLRTWRSSATRPSTLTNFAP
jgi:hypothetical protein